LEYRQASTKTGLVCKKAKNDSHFSKL